MRAFLAIAKVTFIELSRQKVVFLVGFVAAFLIFISLLLASMSLDERLRIIIHIGFGALQFVLAFLALFLGSGLWSKELDRQTLFLILARPISRSQVFWAKWFGLAILVVHFQFVLGALHALLIWDGVHWTRFLWAHFGLLLEALSLLSIAMSLSVLLRPALVSALTLCLWLGGYWQSELLYFAERSQSQFFKLFAESSHYIFPKFLVGTELRSVYFLTEEMISNWGGASLLHICIYSLIILFFGEIWFRQKDLA